MRFKKTRHLGPEKMLKLVKSALKSGAESPWASPVYSPPLSPESHGLVSPVPSLSHPLDPLCILRCHHLSPCPNQDDFIHGGWIQRRGSPGREPVLGMALGRFGEVVAWSGGGHARWRIRVVRRPCPRWPSCLPRSTTWCGALSPVSSSPDHRAGSTPSPAVAASPNRSTGVVWTPTLARHSHSPLSHSTEAAEQGGQEGRFGR